IGERKRLRQQIADAGFVIHDENSRTLRGGARRRRRGGGGGGSRPPAARTLTIEPRVDIALAEAPLAAHAYRWNLSGLDQPVDCAQIDLKIGENFFSCEKRFFHYYSRGPLTPLGPLRLRPSTLLGTPRALVEG